MMFELLMLALFLLLAVVAIIQVFYLAMVALSFWYFEGDVCDKYDCDYV
jgi:hypothetical protein